ncbi:Thioredoxin [Thermosyntropha lipolytica DSM 11003]|uniref:Thioredoxin n=1 Tax=Thermosyntropha lipolytica DSM 11003 TaxID=1123382 RepID=A0A1M5RJ98_9FIRM|nr:thioredoxin family protein [Thermosyntropha lipolytica]SHH26159.1 Thioredoxin [Thermosyntropha lipolytica DSM 11003]
MKRKRELALLILLILLAGGFYLASRNDEKKNTSPGGEDVVWQIKEAKEKGEPMWLLFSSTSCPPCVEMKKVFDRIKPEYEGKVLFINVNVDERGNYDLLREYEIKYIPTTYIIDKKGEITYHNIGIIPEDTLREELNKVVK